ncbi:CLUMA_CG005857, isoform B [Clunio marinus]|nr:CLUMA_CG005857, isoform B [Clunio marinus]
MNFLSLDGLRMWISAVLLLVFVSLGITSTFDPYHDELMGYKIDDDGNIRSNDDNLNEVMETTSTETPITGPYFDYTAFRNVSTLVKNTAYLKCRVRNIGNKTVSWVRHRDIHLLTVGTFSYTSDNRFQSIHDPESEEWILKLQYPQIRDSGIYECQISTTPPRGYPVYLSVVEPLTTIVGGPEIFINTGSTINLTCIVKNSPESPFAMYWTHDDEEINYDSPRGGVSVITEKGEITTSYLLIQRAKPSDSGKYKCSPSNANSKTVHVHILAGEHPEAMQSVSSLNSMNIKFMWSLAIAQTILIVRYVYNDSS